MHASDHFISTMHPSQLPSLQKRATDREEDQAPDADTSAASQLDAGKRAARACDSCYKRKVP